MPQDAAFQVNALIVESIHVGADIRRTMLEASLGARRLLQACPIDCQGFSGDEF